MWFRRDLRLHDNPALAAAVERAYGDGDGRVVPLFVVDPALWNAAGPVRRRYLVESLNALGGTVGRNLLIRHGDPVRVVPEVVAAARASEVHIAADYGPYGSQRDLAVAAALGPISLVRTGSPYAVAPRRVLKSDGTPYSVYTPFYRGWLKHGWRAPSPDPKQWPEWWMPMECEGRPAAPEVDGIELPPAGEQAALERWEEFRTSRLMDYDAERNNPSVNGTSGLGAALKWGEIHPRTLLADLGPDEADDVFRKEIAWREFYADVLARRPDSARTYLNPRFAHMEYTTGPQADDRLAAWQQGLTGFPFVDAGMRQLRDEGWMHNRVRMVVASFLIKDLHLPWQVGARWFMRWLRDGDLASNSHGWQWTAGSGTDASPYYRVFNPITQGEKFDPTGDYVRRYIPELRHLSGKSAHTPWDSPDGYREGYPERIVDHAVERLEALRRLGELPPAG
jgi:deoxyribodipyrimidine photo-lyase